MFSRGNLIGGVNLYAASPGAFAGHQAQLAAALGASAEGALSDADLTFSSRDRAVDTPRRLREQHDVDVAAGFLAARYGETVAHATERMSGAASRAGLTPAVVARVLLDLHTGHAG